MGLLGWLFVILAAAFSAFLCALWSLRHGWHTPQGAEDLVLRTQLVSQAVPMGGALGALFNTMLWMWRQENTLADAMVCSAFTLFFYTVYCQMGVENRKKEE